jgi:hypothetical protein
MRTDTIPLQPVPEDISLNHFTADGRVHTAISRLWPPGSAAHCRLCDRCQVAGTNSRLCTVVVNQYVPRHKAWDYDARGRRDVTPQTGSSDSIAIADVRRLGRVDRKSV